MKLQDNFISITSLNIPFLHRFLLLLVNYFSEENNYCEVSNIDFAKIVHRDQSKVSKAISTLTRQNFLIRKTLDGSRILALGEIANPFINNNKEINNYLLINRNNKIKRNYLLLNKDHNIIISDCDDLALSLINDDAFVLYDYISLCKYLCEQAVNNRFLKNVKTFSQLKAVIYSIINTGRKTNQLEKISQLEFDKGAQELANTIKVICGFERSIEEIIVDEDEEKKLKAREKQHRVLLKGIKESYQEKLIDITSKPEELQNVYKNKKFISVIADLTGVYIAGKNKNELFYNLFLKESQSGIVLYAAVREKHISTIKSKLKGYKGKVKVSGLVYTSDYHYRTFEVRNIIRSIDELVAVEFIEDDFLLDTTLIEPDDEAPF